MIKVKIARKGGTAPGGSQRRPGKGVPANSPFVELDTLTKEKFEAVVRAELDAFGARLVRQFKKSAENKEFRAQGDSNNETPLIESGEYINSYTHIVEDGNSGVIYTLSIGPEGEHSSGLSNEELGDLLEYGIPSLGIPGIPHQRKLVRNAIKQIPHLKRSILTSLVFRKQVIDDLRKRAKLLRKARREAFKAKLKASVQREEAK